MGLQIWKRVARYREKNIYYLMKVYSNYPYEVSEIGLGDYILSYNGEELLVHEDL